MSAQPSRTESAHRLPAPVLGQAVMIPLELLPIYFAAHRLEVMTRGDVSKLEQATGQCREPGVVWVKRIE